MKSMGGGAGGFLASPPMEVKFMVPASSFQFPGVNLPFIRFGFSFPGHDWKVGCKSFGKKLDVQFKLESSLNWETDAGGPVSV